MSGALGPPLPTKPPAGIRLYKTPSILAATFGLYHFARPEAAAKTAIERADGARNSDLSTGLECDSRRPLDSAPMTANAGRIIRITRRVIYTQDELDDIADHYA